MKAIILISSIFYILGLKISNKIDLVKRSNPVEKIIIHKVKPDTQQKSVDFEEAKTDAKESESLKESSNCETLK